MKLNLLFCDHHLNYFIYFFSYKILPELTFFSFLLTLNLLLKNHLINLSVNYHITQSMQKIVPHSPELAAQGRVLHVLEVLLLPPAH